MPWLPSLKQKSLSPGDNRSEDERVSFRGTTSIRRANPERRALFPDHHPGFAVTGSPVPVYWEKKPSLFFGSHTKRLRSAYSAAVLNLSRLLQMQRTAFDHLVCRTSANLLLLVQGFYLVLVVNYRAFSQSGQQLHFSPHLVSHNPFVIIHKDNNFCFRFGNS
jgi:hypothetical protein